MKTKENRGGKREGAGVKQKYGEETEHVGFRVPKSKKNEFKKEVKKILDKWMIKN